MPNLSFFVKNEEDFIFTKQEIQERLFKVEHIRARKLDTRERRITNEQKWMDEWMNEWMDGWMDD